MIGIEIDDRQVKAALEQLQRRVANMTPAMREIGELLTETTKQRFATSTALDGSRWAENSPVTLAKKKGRRPLIGETKRLSTEIDYQAGARSVDVGSSIAYAAVQQFGARPGRC